MRSRDVAACNFCFSCVSLGLFIASIASDWYVHYSKESPVSPTLAGWWHTPSVVGTIIGTIISAVLLILDCCFCCRLDEEDREKQMLWASTGHCDCLVTLCKDLPRLILSLVILYGISSNHYKLCKSSEDVLSAINHNSTISLAGSLLRLMRAHVFKLDGHECLIIFHVLVCIFSFLMFICASKVC